MTCPHCGAQVAPGSRFCNKCRKRVAAGSASARPPTPARAPGPPRASGGGGSAVSSFTRPGVVTLLAVLNMLGGGVALGMAALMSLSVLGDSQRPDGAALMMVLFLLYGLGAVQIATAVGLFRLQPWGRMLQLGLAVVGLLGIPCGTIISILILVYMLKPEVKSLFSGIPPQQLPPGEVARVEQLSGGSGSSVALWVIVAVVAIPVVVAVIGIVAAIAIPSLLRARVSANESGVIGDLRTVVSAQSAYTTANLGYPDQLECLVQPTDCLPNYPETAPVFLGDEFLSPVRRGYEFTFVPGSPAPSGDSPTSLSGWAYVAVPITVGQTGVRSFCADASGMICSDSSGSPPDAMGGSCPISTGIGCVPLN